MLLDKKHQKYNATRKQKADIDREYKARMKELDEKYKEKHSQTVIKR